MSGRRIAVALALLLGASCGDPAEPAEPAFPLGRVVEDALARYAPEEPAPEPAPEDREELLGLTSMAASDPALLKVAREDVRRIQGSAAVLAGIARDPERSDAERAAALDLVPEDVPEGSLALAGLVREATPAWVRARAAWRLAAGGHDACVPDLVLPLKYELDHETVVWIAAALARHGNLAGLDGLIAVSRAADSPARANAEAELARELRELGFDDAAALWRAWHGGDPDRRLPSRERSDAYLGRVWHWIARMEEFQLRGVDDARFVLERLDASAARCLAEALFDESVYVRVHAAQALQRMGPRGAIAGPELVQALAEPELAPHAATALGHVRFAPAAGALLTRLSPETPFGLRLAAVRALGFLGEDRALPALRALLDDPSAELAQAAAESVALLDPEAQDAAERLLAWIEDPRVDPASSERALRAWLYERGADDVIERWDALAAPPNVVEPPEAATARRAERAVLVRAYLGR